MNFSIYVPFIISEDLSREREKIEPRKDLFLMGWVASGHTPAHITVCCKMVVKNLKNQLNI
jgi:hypothetical protein